MKSASDNSMGAPPSRRLRAFDAIAKELNAATNSEFVMVDGG